MPAFVPMPMAAISSGKYRSEFAKADPYSADKRTRNPPPKFQASTDQEDDTEEEVQLTKTPPTKRKKASPRKTNLVRALVTPPIKKKTISEEGSSEFLLNSPVDKNQTKVSDYYGKGKCDIKRCRF